MNHNETGQQPYTKVSLVFKFLYGSKRYFLISIAAALCVTGVDMLSPQLIRTTVDGILGENALQLPRFLVDLVERSCPSRTGPLLRKSGPLRRTPTWRT